MNSVSIKQYYQNEQVAQGYDGERFMSLAGRAFDRLEKRALHKVVDRVLRRVPGPQVLDVPCGTGRITEALLSRGLEITGADISEQMMAIARAKCARFGDRLRLRRLDLDALDAPDGSFDLVTCIRLFHHLETAQRGRILRELARVSRRYVLVNVAVSSPFYRLRRRLKRYLGQGVSKTSSTWSEIRAEGEGAGLILVASSFVCRFVSEDLLLLYEKGSGHK